MDMPMTGSNCTSDCSPPMIMMQMWFTNSNMVTVLFEGWKTSGPCSYWLTLLALFIAGLGYEILSSLRMSLDSPRASHSRHPERQKLLNGDTWTAEDGEQFLLPASETAVVPWYRKAGASREAWLLLRTFVFAVQLVSGYFIMLAVMTYNWGVFLSVILGRVLGYALVVHFRCLSIPVAEEVCH